MGMDEQQLREEEARILAEQDQGGGEDAGDHGDHPGGADAGGAGEKSRFQQRIDGLVAQRRAAEERADTAERAAAEARGAAEAAERIARERSASPETDRPPATFADRRDLVKRKFRAGEIDDDTRVEALANIAADERMERAEEVHGARQVLQSVADEIDGWKRVAPELVQSTSPLRGRVQETFKRLVARGYPADDIRTELTAVENVMGGSFEDFQRRRVIDDTTADQTPRGGIGTGGPGGGGGAGTRRSPGSFGESLFTRLTPDALTELRRMYHDAPDPDAAIKKDLDYADEEVLWRRGRLKSR